MNVVKVIVDGDDTFVVPGRGQVIIRLARGIDGTNGTDGADGGIISPTPFPVVDGTTYVLPAGKLLVSLSVVPALGLRTLTVGYSAGTTELVDNEDVPSNDGTTFTLGRYHHTSVTLHFTGFTGSVLIYLL